ncbi:MAG TPA: response regulator, partial [bacterium]|nr:response regulator [bacterium]
MTSVLIVDDSSLFRTLIRRALEDIPGVQVVATAPSGRLALKRIEELSPHLLTLDLEMPDLDGIGVLKALKERSLDVGVIILSSHTRKAGELTMKALELGAFDFIAKPEALSADEAQAALRESLRPMIAAYARKIEVRSILQNRPL